MNKLTKFFIGLSIVAFSITSCESMLDVDSDLIAFTEENQLNTANDSIYSMAGIFSHLEQLAEGHVILGELRADLMNTTSYSNSDLIEVRNLEISADNPYNNLGDYYTVINHCNYLIKTVDTTIVSQSEKVMYKQFAMAKAIRAWTYMQMVLNYGTVCYYDEPLLDITDFDNLPSNTGREELYSLLIDDLLPWKDEKLTGFFEGLYFPIPLLLGEMYLWLGEYDNAAQEFYNLIEKESYTIPDSYYRNEWTVSSTAFIGRSYTWYNIFEIFTSEHINVIAGSTELGEGAPLDSLINTAENELAPSAVAISNWENQTYYHSNLITIAGDLRGDGGSYFSPEFAPLFEVIYDIPYEAGEVGRISKYINMSDEDMKAVNGYRLATLYLRYAEAVNRAGKPNLAFAVIKNGLSEQTLSIDTIVPRSEKYSSYDSISSTFYPYVDFTESKFSENIGIHARGCGNPDESREYIIPELATTEDSILYVEDKIILELALETAFEGGRFHDLMRIATRRGDNAYLADKVAESHTGDKEAIRSKLMVESNWYLP